MLIDKKFLQWVREKNTEIAKLFRDQTPHERALTMTVKIQEELGELASEVLSAQGRQRSEKLGRHTTETLSAEFADVLLSTLVLGEELGIDVNAALQKKAALVDGRFKNHE